eukprot:GILJ01019708.1.p1 GENE.GILJ01019708.1~~GILJ01019708.1.p1  ORF type:complete len:163 (+),score=15.64 GILJ01019708.1:753-1241(+)
MKELIAHFDFSNYSVHSSHSPYGNGIGTGRPTSSGPATYKAALSEAAHTSSSFPIIPLLHCIVDELRAIETSQPTVLCDDGPSQATAIHWRKLSVVATIYQQVRTCQSTRYYSQADKGRRWADDQQGSSSANAGKVRWLDQLMGARVRTKEEALDVILPALR